MRQKFLRKGETFMKRKLEEKVVAGFLVFLLIFTNFAFVGKSTITYAFDFFKEAAETGHENVKFDAYFLNGEEKAYEKQAEVNEKDLKLILDLKVEDKGYLKDATISFIAPEGQDLNYNIGNLEESDIIQGFSKNILSLKQINAVYNQPIEIPISFMQEEYVKLSKLDQTSSVIIRGTYVTNEGKEVLIEKEVTLRLSWKEKKEVTVSSTLNKFVPYQIGEESGVMVQTNIKVQKTENENTLPVKSSVLEIVCPKIKDTVPTNIEVVAKSTKGTNGKEDEEVTFSKDNYTYNVENNTLTVKVENNEQNERVYSGKGIDEYIVTYTYSNIKDVQENSEVEEKVKVSLQLYNVEEKAETELNSKITLNKIGDIVTFDIKQETEEISKGKMYANYNKETDLYETVIRKKLTINVSNSNLIENIKVKDQIETFVDTNGNVFDASNIYYKETKINKQNLLQILGEDGFVEIKSIDGNLITKLDKTTEPDENGNVVVKYENKLNKIIIETSKPQNNGNLIIDNEKGLKDLNYTKEVLRSFERINNKTNLEVKYVAQEDYQEIESKEQTTKLSGTSSNASFQINNTTWSSIVENKNVELRITLNNDKETSDLYEEPVFEIEFPQYVTRVNVKNANILYNEGLEIENIEVYENNGIKLKIRLKGIQKQFSTGTLTNGTNIILNADIKLNMYTPNKTENVNLYYINKNATKYEESTDWRISEDIPEGMLSNENGFKSIKVNYSAPTGMLSVNSLIGFNSNETISSLRQGRKEATIGIFESAKTIKSEILAMNNTGNLVTDLVILGRVPFKGVKSINSKEDLGTTIDTKVTRAILSDGNNKCQSTIYYSENAEATKSLEEKSNGWTTNPEDLSKVKSYLIVTNNYEMQTGDIVRYSYEYEVPANLEHNANMYGTFACFYNNNREEAINYEVSEADIVGLTTGVGPQIEAKLEANIQNDAQVKEGEKVTYTATVTNTGKEEIKNLKVNVKLPNEMRYVEYSNGSYNSLSIENKEFSVENLKAGETKKFEFKLVAERNDEDYIDEESIVEVENQKNTVKFVVTADRLAKEIESNEISNTIKKADIEVSVRSSKDECANLKANDYVKYDVVTRNISGKSLQNSEVKFKLADGLNYYDSNVIVINQNNGEYSKTKDNLTFDENTREIKLKISEFTEDTLYQVHIVSKVASLVGKEASKTLVSSGSVTADGIEEQKIEEVKNIVLAPKMSVTQSCSVEDTYLKEQEEIIYKITVKNEGTVDLNRIKVVDNIPSELKVKEIRYDGIIAPGKNDVVVNTSLGINETLEVEIVAVAKLLENGKEEVSIKNSATVSAKEVAEQTTNEIIRVVEINPSIDRSAEKVEENNAQNTEENNVNTEENQNLEQSINNEQPSKVTEQPKQTYKISGMVWTDINENGAKDNDEKLLNDVTVNLLNEKGTVIDSTKTINGMYILQGIKEGKYFIGFEYNEEEFAVTTYKQEEVASENQSKVIEKDNGAISDCIVIKDGSISNINMGLVYKQKFDLKLDMKLNKITLQTSEEVKEIKVSNPKLSKVDIEPKFLYGAKVLVEYKILITNEGDIEGNASKIVDYVPEGMTFNSELNPDWYTSKDGNAYTTKLADVVIAPNETKEVTIVLSKSMTENNTGIVNNIAEIAESYNEKGILEKDSIAENKAQNEDDISYANAIITVETGERFLFIGLAIGLIPFVVVVIYLVVKVNEEKKKELLKETEEIEGYGKETDKPKEEIKDDLAEKLESEEQNVQMIREVVKGDEITEDEMKQDESNEEISTKEENQETTEKEEKDTETKENEDKKEVE